MGRWDTPGTSTLTKCEDACAFSLANSATFQAMLGVDDAAAAYQHILYNTEPIPEDGESEDWEELKRVGDFASIFLPDDDDAFELIPGPGVGTFEEGGRLTVAIFRRVRPHEVDEPTAAIANVVGGIIDDFATASQTAGALRNPVCMSRSPKTTNENTAANDMGPYLVQEIEVSYGTQAGEGGGAG